MVVDGKGRIFEDRRKEDVGVAKERRKNEKNTKQSTTKQKSTKKK